MIKLFNTLTGKSDEFKPLKEGRAGIYTCGPTVYDFAHIGNFRAFVFEDLLRRFLEFKGYQVKHVMNLTDVDDKTIAGAQREKKKLDDYTAQYIQAFNDDLKTLNCLPPTVQPRATQKIQLMLDLIAQLMQKGIAYESNGSVYYRVSKFLNYGKLSKKKLEMNIAGASERVDSDEYESKEQVSDFVLWKKSKEGEPSWESPWGPGRPGWHIECSAMSMQELGEQFDIHAGGEDLIFPHHENEIAQSEGATGKDPFVKYWLHCKFLLVNGEKMSKSKGNFYTLRSLLGVDVAKYDPMAIRYALLSTHYRTQLNFTFDGLKEASEVIKKLDDCYFQCLNYLYHVGGDQDQVIKTNLSETLTKFIKQMSEALDDDLNISASLAIFQEGVKAINKALSENVRDEANMKAAIHYFKQADDLYGFDIASVETLDVAILQKLEERNETRRNPDFKTLKILQASSDNLRKEIEAVNWLVKDARPGEPSTVKLKRRVWDK